MSPKKGITGKIKEMALQQGFSACGVCDASNLVSEAKTLDGWLSSGYHGEMAYMANNKDIRKSPGLLLEGARSIIVVLLNYYSGNKVKNKSSYKIAKYALGKDYHYIIKQKLNQLTENLIQEGIHLEGRVFTDSAPVFEKALAMKAGLGWIGKNTCLIRPKAGSYFFIGGIVTSMELEYDRPMTGHCGTCRRCIDACPTSALTEAYTLDARKCISYLSIEHKSDFDKEVNPSIKPYIFGCDICQDVCPHNRFSIATDCEQLRPLESILSLSDDDWEKMDNSSFKKLFKHTALFRSGLRKLKRNIHWINKG